MGNRQAKKTARGGKPSAGKAEAGTGDRAPRGHSSTATPANLKELQEAVGGSGLYVLLALLGAPWPLSRMQIGKETGFDQEAVRRAITKLKPCGLILEIPDGQWPKYHATAVARQLVLPSGAAALDAGPALLPEPSSTTEGFPQWPQPVTTEGNPQWSKTTPAVTEGFPSSTEGFTSPTEGKPPRSLEEKETKYTISFFTSDARQKITQVLRAGEAYESSIEKTIFPFLARKHRADALQRVLACLAFAMAPTTKRGDKLGGTYYPLVMNDSPIPPEYLPPADLPFEQQLLWAKRGGQAEQLPADLDQLELEPAEPEPAPAPLDVLWSRALKELRHLGAAAIKEHLMPARLVAIDSGIAHVHAAHSGSAAWLKPKAQKILEALIAAGCQVHQVEIGILQ